VADFKVHQRVYADGWVAPKGGLQSLASHERGFLGLSANCVESIIGALVIDQGPEVARKFVVSAMLPSLSTEVASQDFSQLKGATFDVISETFHLCHKRRWPNPVFRTTKSVNSHGSEYLHEVGLFIHPPGTKEVLLVTGVGPNIALARRDAATKAIPLLKLRS